MGGVAIAGNRGAGYREERIMGAAAQNAQRTLSHNRHAVEDALLLFGLYLPCVHGAR